MAALMFKLNSEEASELATLEHVGWGGARGGGKGPPSQIESDRLTKQGSVLVILT